MRRIDFVLIIRKFNCEEEFGVEIIFQKNQLPENIFQKFLNKKNIFNGNAFCCQNCVII